jgi:hypothetical protein
VSRITDRNRSWARARALLDGEGMSARAETFFVPTKVICFSCRQSGCACVARLGQKAAKGSAGRSTLATVGGSVKAWALAMGGACLAGGAIGALVALWM